MAQEAAGSGPTSDAFSHCADLVRAHDPDRAIANLFAARERRDALYALYAFDLETAAVRDRVRQPIAGEIRLQWWRDTIAGTSEGEGSPVASALIGTIQAYDLPHEAFDRLLEARIFDLYDDPMPSRHAFETYAGETSSTIVTLASMILDRGAAPRVAGLAGHAGVALTAFAVARHEARLRSRLQIYPPPEILSAVGLDARAYLSGERAERVGDAMRAYGQEHARPVVLGWNELPRLMRPAFLPLRAALASTERPDAARSRIAGLRTVARYWRAMRAPDRGRTAG